MEAIEAMMQAGQKRLDINTYDPVRTKSDKEAIRQGFRFDRKRAKRATDFIERYCCQSIGPGAGKPLVLLNWQLEFVWQLFGWVDKNGVRRFKEAYLEIAKKNGKSTLVAAISLYLLVADGEAVPDIHVNAFDRTQAKIIFEEAARMIKASPELRKRLESVPSSKRIVYPDKDGVIAAQSAEVPNKDGANASAVIFDELHRQRTRAMWDIYKYAGISRKQPIRISITTAGTDRKSICYNRHSHALKVAAGSVIDVRFLGIVYGPKDGEINPDIDDPKVWLQANPSMGTTMSLEGFRDDLEEAKRTPESLVLFKQLRLNIWTQEVKKFIDLDMWEGCPPPRDEFEVADSGDLSFAGLDLSSVRDLTAYVRITGDLQNGFDVHCKFWIPAEMAERRAREDDAPYLIWAEQGFVELTPGPRVDYDTIEAYISADFELTKFATLYSDFYNAQHMGSRLIAGGVPFSYMRQGFLSMNGPTKMLDRLLATGRLRHGNNPVLTWCASNAAAERDKVDNVMLSKSKSTERIDGMIALVESIAGAMDTYGAEDPTTSAYDDDEVFFV